MLNKSEIVKLTKRPLSTNDLIIQHMMAGANLKQASLMAGTTAAGGKKRLETMRAHYKARNNMNLIVILMRKRIIK